MFINFDYLLILYRARLSNRIHVIEVLAQNGKLSCKYFSCKQDLLRMGGLFSNFSTSIIPKSVKMEDKKFGRNYKNVIQKTLACAG